MANALYAKGKEKLLSSTNAISLDTDTIKVALVKNDYAQNLATDVFDADDVVWAAVASGSTFEAVVIYKDTGVAGTSPLIAYIDTITGFPLASNGGDITVQWDNGAYKIFSL